MSGASPKCSPACTAASAHMVLSRVSPLAVPVLLEIGRESVRSGESDDDLLAEAETLVAEATGEAEPPPFRARYPRCTGEFRAEGKAAARQPVRVTGFLWQDARSCLTVCSKTRCSLAFARCSRRFMASGWNAWCCLARARVVMGNRIPDYDIAVFLRDGIDLLAESRALAELETDVLFETGAVITTIPLRPVPTRVARR